MGTLGDEACQSQMADSIGPVVEAPLLELCVCEALYGDLIVIPVSCDAVRDTEGREWQGVFVSGMPV